MKKIEIYLKQKNICPNCLDIYESALTHASYKNEHLIKKDYEKLEFIGDAILEYVVTKYIYLNNPDLNEGDLTKLRSNIVQSSSLAKYARSDKIYNLIRTGKSISKKYLKTSDKYLEDVFEALIGAIWLDQGLEKAELFIYSFIKNDILNNEIYTDPKSQLQEYIQSIYKKNVIYETIEIINNKSKLFKSDAYVDMDKKIYLETGYGSSKKEAEKESAKKYLQKKER